MVGKQKDIYYPRQIKGIMEIISKKEDDALANMPLDKLKEMVDGM